MKRSGFLIACLVAIVLIAAAYANSLDNSFHFDDSHVIENNLYLRSLDYIPRYFTDARTFSSLPQNATYRPLVSLSLAIDYAMAGGLDPTPFHISQIIQLLITAALLVVFFVPLIGRWPALFAATLFSVHTANTETMNLISARSELLSTIALLTSFILYQRSPFARRTLLYLVPLAIGALAKAPLVVFAPLLYVYVRLFEKEPPRRAFRIILPSLVLGIALLIFLNAMNAPEWVGGGGSPLHYAITQPFVWLHYARLFILPLGLTADSDWTPFAQWYDTRAVVGYAFVIALLVMFRQLRRRDESLPIAFGLAWFAIALIPTSSVFPLAEVANEHRIFFAYIGLVLIAAALLRRAAGRWRELAVGAAVVILLVHAVGTYERNKTWRTEETLWADVLTKSPANGRAWMNYGLTHMAQGRYAQAKESFEKAAGLTPNYSVLAINRGIVEGELGDQITAESHFRRALQLNPDANSNFYYARWLVRRGRSAEALPHLREALRLSPAFVDARSLLLHLSIASGNVQESNALLEETRRVDPGSAPRAYASYEEAFAAGLQAMGRSDWLTAAAANRAALTHNARSADAFNNLGWSLASLGFRAEAAAAYQQALALQPNHERARNNLRVLTQR